MGYDIALGIIYVCDSQGCITDKQGSDSGVRAGSGQQTGQSRSTALLTRYLDCPEIDTNTYVTDSSLQELYAILLALIITGIRLAYTLSTIFDSGSLDPGSHSLALEVVLSALPEMVAVIILLAIGFRLLSQRKR